MNTHSKWLIVLTMVILAGCQMQPPKSDIETAIKHYYDRLDLRVVDVVIGDISSQPISEMKYMGTKGYTVTIDRLTLEIGKEMMGARPYTSGERVTFKDGIVTIREDPAQKGRWLIVSVSSNLVP